MGIAYSGITERIMRDGRGPDDSLSDGYAFDDPIETWLARTDVLCGIRARVLARQEAIDNDPVPILEGIGGRLNLRKGEYMALLHPEGLNILPFVIEYLSQDGPINRHLKEGERDFYRRKVQALATTTSEVPDIIPALDDRNLTPLLGRERATGTLDRVKMRTAEVVSDSGRKYEFIVIYRPWEQKGYNVKLLLRSMDQP